ncbi:MAG: GHKL domain-containing protein [Clostridiales Family XIII bacterium]|jgi:hypothetical protein|nr:GHKL domain-containing protein [Clostridiales Family XIII bacterium]
MVKICFELGVNVLQSFMVIAFISRFFGAKRDGAKRYVGFAAAWLMLYLEVTFVNYLTPYEGAAVLISAVICFVYARICLQGEALIHVFISVFIISLIHVIALIGNLIMGLIWGISPIAMITEFNIYRVTYILITSFVLLCVMWILLKIKRDFVMELRDWAPLTAVPILSNICMGLLMGIAAQNNERYIRYNIGASIFVMLGINMVIYYLFIRLDMQNRERMKNTLLQQQYEYGKEKVKEVNALYESIAAVRHEIKNHLTVISILSDDSKNDKIKHYISQIIKEQIDNARKIVITPNEFFNAIINPKLNKCEAEGIHTTVHIKNDLSFMHEVDIGELFGNLFDNAMRACKNTVGKEISLKIKDQDQVHGQSAYVSILMTNSISESVLSKNRGLLSTKNNKAIHGYGIKNMKKIVDKYNGMIDFFEDGGMFCCEILLEKLPISNK